MVRIAEMTLDKNGRPAIRVTANPAEPHAGYSNIHTHDKNGRPALLAVELPTGKLYYFHGNQSQCVPTAWRELTADPVASGDAENGMRGDYCSTYGITSWDYGIITRALGNKLNIPGGMRMSIPAADGSGDSTEYTLGSPQTYTMSGNKTCFLIWQDLDPDEPFQECDQICFRKSMPEESNATCRLWWNGKVWRFRSINYGDVWRECRAQPLVKCIFNADGQLVRLDYTGWYNAAPKEPTE